MIRARLAATLILVALLQQIGFSQVEIPDSVQLDLDNIRALEKKGEFEEAVSLIESSLEKYQDFKQFQGYFYIRLGTSLCLAQKCRSGISYFHKALKNGVENSDTTLIGKSYVGLGAASQFNHLNDSAFYYYELAKTYLLVTNDSIELVGIESNMSMMTENFEEREKTYRFVLDLRERLGDTLGVVAAYHNLGMLFQENGEYREALENFQISYDIAKSKGFRNDQIKAQKGLAIASYSMGEKDAAFDYFLKYDSAASEWIYSEQYNDKILELENKVQMAEVERENEIKQNRIEAQNRLLGTIAFFSLLLLVSVVGLVFSQRNIRRKNQKIETLMRELHHRVKNNLQVISSLLNLQSMKLQDKSAQKAVAEGKERIRAMSLIHQKLYQNQEVTSLDMKDYLTNLVNELAQSYGYKDKAKISVDVPEIVMDVDSSLPVGLIVNELVSNSFKYAFKDIDEPMLELSLVEDEKHGYHLKVKDNGKGLPSDFSLENVTSFGMKLVNLLTKQLNGNISIDSGDGLTYDIKFQIA